MLGYYAQGHCRENFQMHRKQFPSSVARLEQHIIALETEFSEKMASILEVVNSPKTADHTNWKEKRNLS